MLRISVGIFFLLCSATGFAELKVFTTTENLADVVRQVGGDKVSVESLCKGTQDPHYLEAKPSYTFKLSKADLLVSIGAGLEDAWLSLVVRGSRNPKLREGNKGRLVASEGLALAEATEEAVSRADGDVHPEGNPHFMLGPSKSIEIANAVSKRLGELDPKNAAEYSQRAGEYSKSIEKRLKIWKKRIASGLKVISYHKTLTYFYSEFGIDSVDVLEPKPGIPPSAAHVIKLIKKVKERKIKTIVIENYFDDAIARRIKKEVPSIRIVTVPVSVHGTGDVKNLFDLYENLIGTIGG